MKWQLFSGSGAAAVSLRPRSDRYTTEKSSFSQPNLRSAHMGSTPARRSLATVAFGTFPSRLLIMILLKQNTEK